jgi:hypothetical protein
VKSTFDIGESISVKGRRIGVVERVNGSSITVKRKSGRFNPALRGIILMLKEDVFAVKAANGKRLYLTHLATSDEVKLT